MTLKAWQLKRKLPLEMMNCFHCAHAALVESIEYGKKPVITFEGCWERKEVKEPITAKQCLEKTEKGEKRFIPSGYGCTILNDYILRKQVVKAQKSIFALNPDNKLKKAKELLL